MSHGNRLDQNQAEAEISLIDIIRFLKSAYKTILIFGLLGLVITVVYLAITPKQYEAIAQISMAQMGSSNNSIRVNIEEPALLITRLSTPTSFTPEVLSACDLGDKPQAAELLAKTIKLSLPKGVANVVELKTVGTSPKAASTCADAIFGLIQVTQAQIIAPYIEEAKIKLADDTQRLAKAKEFVAKSDKSGQAMSASYLATRDEIRYLLDEITSLENMVTNHTSRATRLIAPIYAADIPVSPKKRMVLLAGLLGGMFLGLLIALGRQLLSSIRLRLQESRQ